MKTLENNIKSRFLSLAGPSFRIISAVSVFLMLISSVSKAQLPDVYVRFNNPMFDCPTQTYCVDVEFRADNSGDTLFGMNVRFFYDDNILEFVGMNDFAPGYDITGPAQVQTGTGGEFFGFPGPLEWVNGEMQLIDEPGIELPVSGWVKIFRICFHVDDPTALNSDSFCPSIVWDLEQNPPVPPDLPGFLPGDDGVVITLVNPADGQESMPTNEHVVQYNWEYSAQGPEFGGPVPIICLSTICWQVPISNWSIVLSIGLMVIASVFIMKRRMNS